MLLFFYLNHAATPRAAHYTHTLCSALLDRVSRLVFPDSSAARCGTVRNNNIVHGAVTANDCVSVVASQNSLGSIDGDADVDGDAEEPDEDDQNRCILCEKCFPDIEQ